MPGSFDVTATPENRVLAQTVAARMAADSRIVNAKAAFWRLLGLGGVGLGVGLGAAAAIYAYSYVADARSSAEKIAEAFAAALRNSTLKAEGVVTVDPKAQVALTNNRVVIDNPRVGLEPGSSVVIRDGGTVSIKPGGTVGVTGSVLATGNVGVSGAIPGTDLDGTRRLTDQPRQDREGGEVGRNGARVMTSVTKFKEVAYGTGKVVTGWNFATSNDQVPSTQYCYYDQGTEGTSVRIELARDGREIPVVRAPRGFQSQDAASNCIWSDGTRTQSSR